MTAPLAILAVVYGLGITVVAIVGAFEWGMARASQRENARNPWARGAQWQQDFTERRHEELEQEARAGARQFVTSPLWPLFALGALVRIINDSKEAP